MNIDLRTLRTEMSLVSIVISAFNEESNIGPLYAAITRALEKNINPVELIFVNDGSSDGTLKKCRNIQLHDGRVKIVNLIRNFGHEIAMTAGMNHAEGDCVIFMDADLQHPPDLIPILIEKWRQGAPVVLTERVANDGVSFFRRSCSRVFYWILNLLADVPILANHPDFRLLDRTYVEILKCMDERDRMLRGMLDWIGNSPYKKTIPFSAPQRIHGITKYSVAANVRLAVDSIIQFSIRPLRLATLVGCFGILFSIFLASFTLFHFLFRSAPPDGYPTLLIAVLLLGSIQLLVLGIMGEYVGRIHMQVKGRPLYVVDNSDVAL